MQRIHQTDVDEIKAFNSVAIDEIELEMVLLAWEQVSIDGVQRDRVQIEQRGLSRLNQYGCNIVVDSE